MGKRNELTLTEVTPYTQLTLLQKRYVEARLQGLNMTAAARAAGVESCAQTSAQNIEKSPKVRAAIRYLIKESTLNVNELTKSDVMTGMMDAVEAAATAGELVMAWREIGKLLGAYEPERKILEIHDYSQDELKTLTDKDLLNLAGGKLKEVVDAEFQEIE
jgi:phage terminase small subunit